MIFKQYDFAFIGGDMRQVYMINHFVELNYSVIVYGLNDSFLDKRAVIHHSLEEVLSLSSIIILPIPIQKGKYLVTKIPVDITIEELQKYLLPSHTVLGGVFTNEFKKFLESSKISFHDLMEVEEIIQYNSIATAEGTISSAIVNSNINLHDSNVLILGYGRCAITLAQKLRYLSKNVTISTRRNEPLYAAHASSFSTIPLNSLSSHINEFDYIFNTIPSMVLTSDLLDKTKVDVCIIDIASNPGGVDFEHAAKIHRYANLYLGIPGKVAPKSSADFLTKYIIEFIRKM